MRSSENTLPSGPTQPAAQVRRTSPYAAAWAVLGLFVLLALVLTWPLAAHLSTRLPGTATWAFDESTFAWNIWYFKHALLDLQTSPLHSNLIWFPLGIDLILYTYNFFSVDCPAVAAGRTCPWRATHPALATVLSGSEHTCWPAICWAILPRRLARRDAVLAAFVAGIICAFASNRPSTRSATTWSRRSGCRSRFYLVKTLREPRLKTLLAGLFFALAALAEMIFASFLALFSLIILVAPWRSLRLRWAAPAGHRCCYGRGALCRAAAGGARVYPRLCWRAGESIKLSADLVGLVTPTAPIRCCAEATGSRRCAVEEGKGRWRHQHGVLGWVTLALALVGAWVAGTAGGLGVERRVRHPGTGAAAAGQRAFRFSLDGLLPVTFPLPFAAPLHRSSTATVRLIATASSDACWPCSSHTPWGGCEP